MAYKDKEKGREYNKEYYIEHKEKLLLQGKEYRERNKEKVKEYEEKRKHNLKRIKYKKKYMKEYHQSPKYKARKKEYCEKNRDKINEKAKEYSQRSEIKVRRKEYDKKTKGKIRLRMRGYYNQRIKNDLNYHLICKLRVALYKAFKRFSNTGKIMTSKKYKIDYKAIIEHLKPFPKNIENYHIDHIIPLSLFDFNNPEHIKKAFLPQNHQFLTIQQNLEKNNRLVMPCAFK